MFNEEPTISTQSPIPRQRRRLTFAEKLRLVNLARHAGPSATARALQVSRDTVYHWLTRYEEGGTENLHARPRGKPVPKTVTPAVADRLGALHAENPRRSAAKVARLYEAQTQQSVHRSTVWAVLKKRG
jgi:transposase